jgi:hypothetical protein
VLRSPDFKAARRLTVRSDARTLPLFGLVCGKTSPSFLDDERRRCPEINYQLTVRSFWGPCKINVLNRTFHLDALRKKSANRIALRQRTEKIGGQVLSGIEHI